MRSTLFLMFLLGCPSLLLAGWFGADFSADAVQYDPQNRSVSGRMFVGKGRVRTELTRDGVSVVEIIDPEKAVALLLFPSRKQYMERRLPKMAEDASDAGNPCNELPNMQCHKIGTEKINEREAEKWEITNPAGEKAYQWSDLEHHFAIKREFAGSVMLELTYQGNEALNGRNTEKWRSVLMQNDGKPLESYQWYDPKLNIAIKQALADGSVRVLKNIVVAAQPDTLFQVPADFQKVSAEQPPAK